MSLIVYFSSRSENTHRFVQRLGLPAVRIPLNEREHLRVDEPYILIVPSYGGGGTAGAVPRQAIRFLNDVHNRQAGGVPEMSSRKNAPCPISTASS